MYPVLGHSQHYICLGLRFILLSFNEVFFWPAFRPSLCHLSWSQRWLPYSRGGGVFYYRRYVFIRASFFPQVFSSLKHKNRWKRWCCCMNIFNNFFFLNLIWISCYYYYCTCSGIICTPHLGQYQLVIASSYTGFLFTLPPVCDRLLPPPTVPVLPACISPCFSWKVSNVDPQAGQHCKYWKFNIRRTSRTTCLYQFSQFRA